MSPRAAPLVAAIVVGFATVDARAVDLIVSAAYVAPARPEDPEPQDLTLDSSPGPSLAVAVTFGDRFGIEGAVCTVKHEVERGGVAFGEIGATPVLLTVPVHLTPRKRFDLFIGPTLGYEFWKRLESNSGESLETRSGVLVGASIGLDLPLGSRWGFATGLRYLQNRVDIVATGERADVSGFLSWVGARVRL